jgi:hypothetical protein
MMIEDQAEKETTMILPGVLSVGAVVLLLLAFDFLRQPRITDPFAG